MTSSNAMRTILRHRKITVALIAVLLLSSAIAWRWWNAAAPNPDSPDAGHSAVVAKDDEQNASGLPSVIHVNDRAHAGIAVEQVQCAKFKETIRLTGKVSLNEDRIAHIFPMVEGTVEKVSVTLGQVVHANDLLVTVHSREVGKAKLELYQARLQHEMAEVKDKLQQEIVVNTRDLLRWLRDEKPIVDIEKQFRERTMGDYREKLLLAYSSYLKSEADLQRLEAVSDKGAISAKQIYAAQAGRNADQATFQARIEQVEHELRTSALLSSQAVKEAFTRVAVAETGLRILGCSEDDIRTIDPVTQGESISDYAIRAPFDGTIIAKDVVLKEQARMDTQIISIADLSTVWITADIYEQNIPLLNSVAGKKIFVSNEVWPDRVFEAQVFFTGEVMDENTRTLSLRAAAANPEHVLKPGMFVNIEVVGQSEADQLQIPVTAIQEYQGEQFVFVQKSENDFERRPVVSGLTNTEMAVIVSGLSKEESVVVQGGFVLKSMMLADLMGEE